jgi:hypothetical protein
MLEFDPRQPVPHVARPLLPLLGLWLAAFGCGHGRSGETEWQASMGRYFANGSVRPPEPPRRLWERGDEDLFLHRMGLADVVAVGVARVVTVHSTFDTPKQVALAFQPREVLHGSLEEVVDDDGELLLPLGPDSEDFQLAVKVHPHLPGSRYVLMLKKQARKDRPTAVHWALYRPDDQLLAEIRAMFKWLERRE